MRLTRAVAPAAAALFAGCTGLQSALDPAGAAAREIAALWWAMAVGGVAVFALVLALLLYALFAHPDRNRRVSPRMLVVLGGIVLPIVVLSALVPFNAFVAAGVDAPRTDGMWTIRVDARQWWWDIEYDDGTRAGPFTTANELYLPVGEPVELLVASSDVVHSFWLPRIAGKIDLIPGHTNRLVVEAELTGVARGQCAEFCGVAHTKMSFLATVVTPEAFDDWVSRQRDPAIEPAGDLEQRGRELFFANGCALCHTVRGHGAWGRTGPDLTHIGTRRTIGAVTMTATRDNIATWIAHNDAIKPGNRMPDYADVDPDTRLAIAAYLAGLE